MPDGMGGKAIGVYGLCSGISPQIPSGSCSCCSGTDNNGQLWLYGGRLPSVSIVPTSHNFSTVINLYDQFRLSQSGNASGAAFQSWLTTINGFKSNTAAAYLYPLGSSQLDVLALTDSLVKQLAGNPLGVFAAAHLARWRCNGLNVPQVLKCVFVVGAICARRPLAGGGADISPDFTRFCREAWLGKRNCHRGSFAR